MSTDLIRTKLQSTLRSKSALDLLRVRSVGTTWLLIDVSGSMDSKMENDERRIDGLRKVIDETNPDRSIKMIAFGLGMGLVDVVTDVPEPSGSTPLAQAIDLAKSHNAGKIVVISDGIPDSAQGAMDAAKRFGGVIDVVFVGNKGEYGEQFLKELSAVTSGTEFHGDLSQPKELSGKIMGLLGSGENDDDDDDDKKGVIAL